MKIKVNDKVLIITGKDRGKTGKVIRTVKKSNKVVVEGINIRTKHIKKTQQRAGEIIKYEAPLQASNVMILDPKDGKPARIGYKVTEKGKKERISKLSGASLDNVSVVSVKAKKTEKKKESKDTTEKAPKGTKKKTIKA